MITIIIIFIIFIIIIINYQNYSVIIYFFNPISLNKMYSIIAFFIFVIVLFLWFSIKYATDVNLLYH